MELYLSEMSSLCFVSRESETRFVFGGTKLMQFKVQNAVSWDCQGPTDSEQEICEERFRSLKVPVALAST